MTNFQRVAIPLLALLAGRQLLAARREPTRRVRHVVAAVIWFAAIAAVADASLTTWIAGQFGIGRGADLVLYVFVLATLAAGLHFFARIERLETDVTRLVRALAIEDGLRRAGAGRAADAAIRLDP